MIIDFKRKDIPEGFPIDLTEKELHKVIRLAHNTIAHHEFHKDIVSRLGPVVQVAQSELQQRASNRLAHSANIFAIVAIGAGLISAGIDALTFFSSRGGL